MSVRRSRESESGVGLTTSSARISRPLCVRTTRSAPVILSCSEERSRRSPRMVHTLSEDMVDRTMRAW